MAAEEDRSGGARSPTADVGATDQPPSFSGTASAKSPGDEDDKDKLIESNSKRPHPSRSATGQSAYHSPIQIEPTYPVCESCRESYQGSFTFDFSTLERAMLFP